MTSIQKITKKVEHSEAVVHLFKALEKENNNVKDFLMKKFQGQPVSPEIEEKAFDYFISHSVITAATVANPGSSVTTEFLYDGLQLPSPIDRYFLEAEAGRAVKDRLIVIEEKLPEIVEEYNNEGSVLIGNVGSGPGRDVINILSRYSRTLNIKVVNIDKDGKALDRGRMMATKKGVDHLIEFVEGDFLKHKPVKKFDIVLLIGILCPLEIKTCITFLKIIKKLLKEGGCLIASNASKKMLKEDPFTCYIMEWTAGWKLVYKDVEEIEQIYKKAGYIWKGCFSDSYGFHIMGMGTSFSKI